MFETTTHRLSDVIDIIGGGTPKRKIDEYWGGEILWLSVVDFNSGSRFVNDSAEKITELGLEKSSTKLLDAGQIIISARGTVGCLAQLVKPMAFNQSCYGLTGKEEFIENDFLYYLMCLKVEELKRKTHGAVFDTITRETFNYIEVELPPIPVQREIAKILGDLDNKIELNRQTNQTLEQIAQALFKSWFVDFEPVKAKIKAKHTLTPTLSQRKREQVVELAAMCAISGKTEEQLKDLDKDALQQLKTTAALFPDTLVETELGEIPEGWGVVDLGDQIDVLETGSRPKGGVKGITEGVPSVGAENINGVGNYAYEKEKFVPQEFFDKLKRGIIQDLDFLLYKDGGKPGDFKPRVSMFGCGFPYDEFAINEHVFRIRSESLGQSFLYFQIGHERVLADLRHKGAKAAIPGINQTDVKTIKLVKPSNIDVLKTFNAYAQPIMENILKRSKENLGLANLRDALLPKLLSGEITLNSTTIKDKPENSAMQSSNA